MTNSKSLIKRGEKVVPNSKIVESCCKREHHMSFGEDSVTQDVGHLPEKCRADPDLFQKGYYNRTIIRFFSEYQSGHYTVYSIQ